MCSVFWHNMQMSLVSEHIETTAYHGHTHSQCIVLELDGIYDRQYFDNCAGKCKILVCLELKLI